MNPAWLEKGAIHLCIDMQRLFAAPLGWQVASIEAVTRPIARISQAIDPGCSLYVGMELPRIVEDALGAWRDYYHEWPQFTGQRLDPALLQLLPGLSGDSQKLIAKRGFGAFHGTDLEARLRQLGAETLIVTGVETDICVLSTVMAAIDCGFRIVIPTDAVTSSDPAGHDAALTILSRLPELVALTTSETLISLLSA